MQPYATRDLYIASFLLARGHKLTGHDADPPARFTTFKFEETSHLKEDLMQYYNNVPVPISTFVQAHESLKRTLREAGR